MAAASRLSQPRSRPADERAETSGVDSGLYMIAPLAPSVVGDVARVHIASFQDSFLASLGERVLRHYFRAFLDYPQGCGFVCLHRPTGTVVGFVCGSEDVTRHWRVFLRRRLVWAAPALAARVLREPQLALALLSRLQRVAGLTRGARRTAPITRNSTGVLPPASLMTIGVDPAHQRQGIGELLVRAFTGEMARRGVRVIKLGVRDENTAARRLYERLGWRPVRATRGPEGTGWMYVRELDGGPPAAPAH